MFRNCAHILGIDDVPAASWVDFATRVRTHADAFLEEFRGTPSRPHDCGSLTPERRLEMIYGVSMVFRNCVHIFGVHHVPAASWVLYATCMRAEAVALLKEFSSELPSGIV